MDSKSSQKYLILFCAAAMNMLLGANYAWSIFAQELKNHYGFSMAQGQSVFSAAQLVFTFIFIIGGRIHDTYGPRVTGFIAGLVFGGGYFLAGSFPISYPSVLVLVGVMSGTGIGLGYLCPMATVQKWFPDRKALVTGIAVAGFGLGSFFVALIAQYLLSLGLPLNKVFRILGVSYFIIISGMALALRLPEGCADTETVKTDIRSILSSRLFWSLFIPMTAGLFAGLMVISNLKPMGVTWLIPEFQAAAGISVLALFNGTGRSVWGYIIQKIGENKAIAISLLAQAATLFLSVLLVRNAPLYYCFAALAGFNYGASLVIYASKVSKIYGVERLGIVYPLLFVSNAFSGFLAPVFAGRVFDKTGSYNIALFSGAGICLAGYLVFLLLNPDKTD